MHDNNDRPESTLKTIEAKEVTYFANKSEEEWDAMRTVRLLAVAHKMQMDFFSECARKNTRKPKLNQTMRSLEKAGHKISSLKVDADSYEFKIAYASDCIAPDVDLELQQKRLERDRRKQSAHRREARND